MNNEAPECPTCKSSDKDIRNLGCNGSYGVLHDNCGSEPCPDAWHAAPTAPDERDKQLARELIGNVNNYAEEHTGELSVSAFGPLSQRIAAALATERETVWVKAIRIVRNSAELADQRARKIYNEYGDADEVEMEKVAHEAAQNIAAALESARTGKVEG